MRGTCCRAPPPGSYDGMREFIEVALPAESPTMYGLHPNAQLSLLSSQAEGLFKMILEVCGDMPICLAAQLAEATAAEYGRLAWSSPP